MKRFSRFIFFGFVLITSQFLHAYPETIRHGYVNCMACHSTQQGGDLLTSYGRELGKELFSRNDSLFKTSPTEKKYWEVETPEWLRVGASARLLQTLTESSVASKGRFMVMQLDMDVVAQATENFQVYGSLGRFENTQPQAEWRDFIYVPRAWIQYSQSSASGGETTAARLGRFYPTYGINVAEHAYVNRKFLELNPGQERVAVEVAWSNENYQLVGTALFQRAQNDKFETEKGYVLQASKVFSSSTRVGVNIYRSVLEQNSKSLNKAWQGAFALIGWTPQISTLFQVDMLEYEDGKKGVVDFLKVGYEYTQGVQLFATQEYFNSDTQKTDPHVEAFGVGVQYFPVPNFDVLATFKKQKDSAQLNEHQNVVWIIAHMYL